MNQQPITENYNEPSICIPRMEMSTPSSYIFKKLNQLNMGKIEKIIELPLKNEEDYKRIIVKLKWNKTTPIRSRLLKGESINLVYDSEKVPWFWKIMSTCPRK